MTTIVLTNGTIFDGSNEELLEGGSIVIENGTIREVSPGAATLPGADVIDLRGRFIMPGLIDAHFHAYGISYDMAHRTTCRCR
jgi:imidazolonepropionase-like amidohydrolase